MVKNVISCKTYKKQNRKFYYVNSALEPRNEKIAQKNGSLNRNLLNLFIGRVYFRLYLVNPHVQAVQKMYAKGGYRLWHTFSIQIEGV